MSKNTYTNLMDSIKASECAVEKAVKSIYSNEKANNVISFKHRRKSYTRFVPITAMLLVLLILVGTFSVFTGLNSENSFVLNVGAAEVNSLTSVKIGELKDKNNALRLCFDTSDKVNYMVQCKTLDFPIVCTGNNIDKINYKINGNGYFAILKTAQGVTDKVYVEGKPVSYEEAQKYPYDIAVTKEYTEKVLSFTVDYNNQSESMAIIGLYTVDDNGKYCETYNANIHYDKQSDSYIQGKDFDYEDMYYSIFNKADYSVDITVTYNNGTTETKTVDLHLKKEQKPYESGDKGEYTSLVAYGTVVQ